jgi:HAE1 family hydrophobic/amphiphilic exporter-1
MLKSVNVNGKSNPGFSSGDAIIAVQEVAAQHLKKPILMSSLLTEKKL